jgi:uncharacterized protein with von Willebrand factor type A (vWA) domain
VKLPLIRFLQAARSAGLPISVAESLDAFHAVDLIGYDDRATLKDTLGLVLAKTHDEKQVFSECFDLYFQREDLFGATVAALEVVPESGDSLLAHLLEHDRTALATALEEAAASVDIAGIRLFTQTGMFVQRILERLGLEGLLAEIARLRESGGADGAARAERLERALDDLRAQVRHLVERHLALATRGENEHWRDRFLINAKLSRLERKDHERLRVIVRALAKRLATRYGRNRRRVDSGQLDVRRTLRRNMSYDGVPFVTVWKARKIEKPRVLVLCDVSGSVAAAAQFLLLFLYSLSETLSDIRAFAFSSHLIEVSDILEGETIEDAIAKIMKLVGYGSSDYGRSLADFADGWLDIVDKKTSIIILGDGRTNYANPRIDIMQALYARAKNIIWLNPEAKYSWGSGDSEILRYRTYTHLTRECGSVHDLEAALEAMLKRSKIGGR